MTKTEILTDITTKFADESNITATELREVIGGIVDYLVPDVIDITHETPSTIINFGTGTEGFVYISKVGRLVTMYGNLTNVSGSLGQASFVIIDEDYESDANPDFPLYGNGVRNLFNNLIQTIDSIPSGVTVPFSITYLTNS